MKKYISIIASAAALILSGCAAKEGTEPGTDASPKVVVYTYNPGAGYNPDNDVAVKITANGAVDEVYYLLEKADDFNANLESKGESGYADYVKANGTKASLETLEFNGSKYFNTIITNVLGESKVVAVGVSSGNYSIANADFVGLTWTDLASGTFSSETMTKLGLSSIPAKLQKCDQVEGRYRFPDLFAEGYHRVFTISGKAQKDDQGDTFYNIVIANQETGLTYGNYGMISARDVSTWQNNSNYLVYNAFYPDYNYVIAWTQYNVTAGNLGYGDDEFSPED